MSFQFPDDYPKKAIHIELKSKVLSPKLLHKLTEIVEDYTKTLVGQYQVTQ